MEERTQVCCQCGEGRCFQEEDAAWRDSNSALVSSQNTISKRRGLFLQLETERLRDKGAWMDRLQVQGTFQVRCRRLAEEKP